MLRSVRYVLWALVIGAIGVLVAAWTGWPSLTNRSPQSELSVADIGGPFTLTNHKGELVSDADLKGKPYVLFFGFTHCPDVCPTTLWELSELMKELGPDANELTVVFVTVDPERDSEKVMADYLASFDRRIVGLTGTRRQIDAVVKLYRAYSKKVPTTGSDYTMDHTATVYLMDQEGRFFGRLDRREQRDVQLKKLHRLISKAGS